MSVLPDQLKSALKVVGVALAVLATVLLVTKVLVPLVLALFSLAAILLVPAIFVVGMAGVLVDPILVAVTEDGYWIEIDRWWN